MVVLATSAGKKLQFRLLCFQRTLKLEHCNHYWGCYSYTLNLLDADQRKAIKLIEDLVLLSKLLPLSYRWSVCKLSLSYRYFYDFWSQKMFSEIPHLCSYKLTRSQFCCSFIPSVLSCQLGSSPCQTFTVLRLALTDIAPNAQRNLSKWLSKPLSKLPIRNLISILSFVFHFKKYKNLV